VKNLRIYNFWTGIFVLGASNISIIGNYFENTRIHLITCPDYIGDLIKHNIFRDAGIFVDYNTCGLDVITENNFFNGWIAVGLSVVPIVEKNYWSDYNGTDNNGDGIGDTPYISPYVLDEIVQDDYPLVAPLDIEVIPEFPSWITLPLLLIATMVVMVARNKLIRKKLE
jgi:nitrous oxidase accessory protein NosD